MERALCFQKDSRFISKLHVGTPFPKCSVSLDFHRKGALDEGSQNEVFCSLEDPQSAMSKAQDYSLYCEEQPSCSLETGTVTSWTWNLNCLRSHPSFMLGFLYKL